MKKFISILFTVIFALVLFETNSLSADVRPATEWDAAHVSHAIAVKQASIDMEVLRNEGLLDDAAEAYVQHFGWSKDYAEKVAYSSLAVISTKINELRLENDPNAAREARLVYQEAVNGDWDNVRIPEDTVNRVIVLALNHQGWGDVTPW